ncbi:threonine kinase [Salipiger aestuarii]|uniref:Threonine kinase n=1 Tax=Salipiger aestuarii TaxID=568098 RepID=A0A327Y5V1_9RHOB|nr:hypothetical protein [Salipiger aestuarii]RAK13839.1 threonine kinase [Salipiger aestuarii]
MLQTMNFERLDPHSWLWQGVGHCSGHFGELLQGRFSDGQGGSFRGLVTLSCRSVGSTARAIIVPGDGDIEAPRGLSKVARAAQTYRNLHHVPRDQDFRIDIISSIPSGIGMGSSTADIVATVRALDQACGHLTGIDDLVALVLSVEEACDSTMLDHNVRLFAQRDGKVREEFGVRLPPFYVLGVNMMPGEVFVTDDMPPAEYSAAEIGHFDELLQRLRLAVRDGDVRSLAAIATESAMINERKYPKSNIEHLLVLRKTLSASGICISHSGTVTGLIFPLDALPLQSSLNEASSEITSWGSRYLGLYRI